MIKIVYNAIIVISLRCEIIAYGAHFGSGNVNFYTRYN